jgi:hypothetical protein
MDIKGSQRLLLACLGISLDGLIILKLQKIIQMDAFGVPRTIAGLRQRLFVEILQLVHGRDPWLRKASVENSG